MTQLNSSAKANTCQRTVSVLQVNEWVRWAHFQSSDSNHDRSNTMLTRYYDTTITGVENLSFGTTIKIIWRRSRLVSEENSVRICEHAFSRPFHAQIFVLMSQIRYFFHTFDRTHSPNSSQWHDCL